jgi:hypothetical protein
MGAMTSAYLVLFFDVRSGTPIFKGVGIFGQDAEHLSTDLSGRTLLVGGPMAEADSYEEAKQELLQHLKVHSFYRDWVVPHLEIGIPNSLESIFDAEAESESNTILSSAEHVAYLMGLIRIGKEQEVRSYLEMEENRRDVCIGLGKEWTLSAEEIFSLLDRGACAR